MNPILKYDYRISLVHCKTENLALCIASTYRTTFYGYTKTTLIHAQFLVHLESIHGCEVVAEGLRSSFVSRQLSEMCLSWEDFPLSSFQAYIDFHPVASSGVSTLDHVDKTLMCE